MTVIRDKETQGQEKGTTTSPSPSYIIMDKKSALIETIEDEIFDALHQELLKYRSYAQKSQNMYMNTPWYNVFRLFKLKLAVKRFSREADCILAEITLLDRGVIL